MKRGLAFWVVVAVFVIAFALALNSRYGFIEGVQLAPLVSLKTVGIVGGQSCCLCAYDKQWPGSSQECDRWLLSHTTECAMSKKVQYDSDSPTCWQDLSCNSPFTLSECKGKKLLFETFGHSYGALCKPFADYVFKVCVTSGVSCAEVVNNGCLTFSNPFEAYAHISSLGETCPGVRVSITGNQCVTLGDQGDDQNECRMNEESTSFCTISVSAECSQCTFAPCNFGGQCSISSKVGQAHCDSAYCTDSDGSVVKKVCCDLVGGPTWQKEGSCPACEGSCCVFGGFCFQGNDFSFLRLIKGYEGSNQAICENDLDGRWSIGKSCESNLCPTGLLGACCLASRDESNVECTNLMTSEECLALDDNSPSLQALWSEGKSCTQVNSCEGACCITYKDGTKSCTSSSEMYCAAQEEREDVASASWGAGKECRDFCESENGACCVEGSACFPNSDLEYCDYREGILHPGTSCDELNFCGALGSCCASYDSGLASCRDGVTYSQCQDVLKEEGVVHVVFKPGTCADSQCEPARGACCKTNICTGGEPICVPDQTYQACKAAEVDGCTVAQWSPGKKCNEITCDLLGCRETNPVSYIGPSCESCKRNFCSLYDIMNGGCPSWCSPEADFRGDFCCGPQ